MTRASRSGPRRSDSPAHIRITNALINGRTLIMRILEWIVVGLVALFTPAALDGPRFEKYSGEYAYGLTVLPPWADGGRLVVNFPEHLEYESRGMGILRYSDKEPRGHWEVSADGGRAT